MVDQIQKLQLLEELYCNSRTHSKDLAEKLHLSRQTISKMKNAFWDKNIVNSPTILINPHTLNLQFFFMEIKTNPSEPEILKQFLSFNETEALDGILGDYSLIVKFCCPTKRKFSEVLDQIDTGIAQSLFQSYRIIEAIEVFKLGGFILEKTLNIKHIDEKRWFLIQLLKKNYNIHKWPINDNIDFNLSEIEILNNLNLSRELDRLVKDRIIQNFTITLKPAMVDFSTKFYIRIKPKKIGQYTDLAHRLIHHPNIIELYRTGEDAGLLAIVRTKGLNGFKNFIQQLYGDYDILNTYTTVVLDEHIPTIYPPTLKISQQVSNSNVT